MSWTRTKPANWEYFRVKTWQGYTAHVRVDGNCWATRVFLDDFQKIVDGGGSLDAIVERTNEIIRPYSGAMRRELKQDHDSGEIYLTFYNRDYTDIDSLHDPFEKKHIPVPMNNKVFDVLRGLNV